MKNNLRVTLIMLTMFILAQFIGLFVIHSYFSVPIENGVPVVEDKIEIPFFQESSTEQFSSIDFLISFALSFIIVILIFLFLIKRKSQKFLRAWFFLVVTVSLSIVFNLLFLGIPYSLYVAIFASSIFAYFKVYRRNLMVHNLSELLIYPGISVIFVQYLTPKSIIFVLIAISIYDLWAVWKSGIMQKMAKYQMDTLKIFSGFMVPGFTKEQKEKIKNLSREELKKKKMNVRVAILGGGDVVFPIVTSGIFLINYGFFSAFCTFLGATLGLSYIFFFGQKEKPYPAMPYITTGIFLGILIWKAISLSV